MDIAIIGLPQSGKTAVFNALTAGHAATSGAGGGGPALVGVVKVIDPRLAELERMYRPRRVVYPEIRLIDLPPAERDAPRQALSGRQRNLLQGAAALLLVVRAFDNPALPPPPGGLQPARDLQAMLEELALADLETLERAGARLAEALQKSKPAERPAIVPQAEAVGKARAALEHGRPVRRQPLTPSERAALADFQLLTAKPVIIAWNTGENEAESAAIPPPSAAADDADGDLGEVRLCARLEEDLAAMGADEAAEFREALGLSEPAVEQVKRVCYATVGLVSFLTVGEDEVRAWPVPSDLPAVEAAGTIHSDFTRGFIRAEVIRYDDLVRCGSIAQGRKEGVLRSEGKTYPVQDGDVINFLVNV